MIIDSFLTLFLNNNLGDYFVLKELKITSDNMMLYIYNSFERSRFCFICMYILY